MTMIFLSGSNYAFDGFSNDFWFCCQSINVLFRRGKRLTHPQHQDSVTV